MEAIALLAEVVMEVTVETVPLEKVVMEGMEGTAKKVPVETVGMGAMVLEEEVKEGLVGLDLKEMDQMEAMEKRNNRD